MKQQRKVTSINYITYALLLVLCIAMVQASSLDQAQESIDKFYLYAQEQNVDAYAALFDQEYLIGLYGSDYKTGLQEVLSYITIIDYEITPQYYTESEDSLTYFFNLKSSVIIENEKTKLDNDMVALFTKKNNDVQLNYVLLQETFIEQMNREVIYEAAIASMTEEYSDLKTEAEEKNVPLVDYESLINNSLNKDKAKQIIKNLIIVLLIAGVIYAFIKHKEKILTKENQKKMQKSMQRVKKHAFAAKTKLVDKYNETTPKIKKASDHAVKKIQSNKQYQQLLNKTKKATTKANKKAKKK